MAHFFKYRAAKLFCGATKLFCGATFIAINFINILNHLKPYQGLPETQCLDLVYCYLL